VGFEGAVRVSNGPFNLISQSGMKNKFIWTTDLCYFVALCIKRTSCKFYIYFCCNVGVLGKLLDEAKYFYNSSDSLKFWSTLLRCQFFTYQMALDFLYNFDCVHAAVDFFL